MHTYPLLCIPYPSSPFSPIPSYSGCAFTKPHTDSAWLKWRSVKRAEVWKILMGNGLIYTHTHNNIPVWAWNHSETATAGAIMENWWGGARAPRVLFMCPISAWHRCLFYKSKPIIARGQFEGLRRDEWMLHACVGRDCLSRGISAW